MSRLVESNLPGKLHSDNTTCKIGILVHSLNLNSVGKANTLVLGVPTDLNILYIILIVSVYQYTPDIFYPDLSSDEIFWTSSSGRGSFRI